MLRVEGRTAAGDVPISTGASRLRRRGAEQVSRIDVFDRLLRTNPVYYWPARRLVQQLGSMDRDARRAMLQQLTQRTLRWAEKTDAGVPARITLLDRPFIEKAQLRARPDAYQVRGAVRVDASTSGSSGLPVRLQRSLRCIAGEQAFLDSLLTEQQLTFHTARVARLRADRIKSVNDREPPYGVESADGRLMKLSPNHLGPDTAQWFCDALRRFAPDLLYTNPSHVETLAAFVRQHDLTLPIPLVITTSETLDSNGRALIEEAFGATVIDYYGQAERVVFAAASLDDGYYFNPAYGRANCSPTTTSPRRPGIGRSTSSERAFGTTQHRSCGSAPMTTRWSPTTTATPNSRMSRSDFGRCTRSKAAARPTSFPPAGKSWKGSPPSVTVSTV
jgi:hypothetical protein